MSIIISGTTGIDAGSLPVSNCGNTEVEGNLNLSGVGTGITGDFSNATASNRVAFQTNTLNGDTYVLSIPNGTSSTSSLTVANSSTATNCSYTSIGVMNNRSYINSGILGSGTYVPLIIQTGGSERVRIDTAGRVGIGTTTPTTTLDVVGDGRFQQQATSGTSGAIIIKEDSGSVNGGVIQWVDPTNTLQRAAIKVKPDYSWEFTNGTNYMFKVSTAGDFLATLGTGGIGYGTGAGGTVTQLTSKSTAVTLNKPSGQITMNNAALAAGASVEFYLNNSLLTSTDTLVVSGGIYSYNYTTQVKTVSSSIATIRVTNVTGGTLSEALGISFTVLKGATA